jgi:predicted DNA-binding ribbon-helix-helix protein
MRLEPEVWDALRELCLRESIELRELIRMVERDSTSGGRTSAVRVHVLEYYREAATDAGHVRAGHGTMTATGPLNVMREIDVDAAPIIAGIASSQMADSEPEAVLKA